MTDPRSYAPGVGARVCEMIREGHGLRAIARAGLSDLATLAAWRAEVPEFRTAYALARRDQGELLSDEVVEIADGASDDDMALAKLRVDARKWLVGILREDFATAPEDGNYADEFIERLREAEARIAARVEAERAEAAREADSGHG
jgi:hypothetical protein